MSLEPFFLTVEDILEIHARQQKLYGGGGGIRDYSLLESAVAQPQVSFEEHYLHSDLFEMAAAYAFHIAENQPFLDGNKRTGLAAALIFLELNGVIIRDESDELHRAMMNIAAGTLGKNDLAALFRKLSLQ